jgi:fructosamine-3-kinase
MTAGTWKHAVQSALGAGGRAAQWQSQSGSSLNETWRLEVGGARYFVKANVASRLPMFAAEADALRELARAGTVRVPLPVASGKAAGVSYLVLEWLDLGPGGRGAALGRALARLHRHTADGFGWHRDNTIGTMHQANAWCDDWAEFFAECRIGPQLALAVRNGHTGELQRRGARLLAAIPALLAGHAPRPALLHGDLWSGNAAAQPDGVPVVFDPAVYYGDREADLAMTELFGGFDADFYAAYRAEWPLDPGYEVRRTLYNVYHVLNHLNLFGGAYRARAEAMIAQLHDAAT